MRNTDNVFWGKRTQLILAHPERNIILDDFRQSVTATDPPRKSRAREAVVGIRRGEAGARLRSVG